ncbi:MAG TPA: AMP-binding protein [Pyrinomonadaceae bacterium]|nr:AMP-binding protein [Pyrinomonadaceae bacterium]
MSPSFIEEIEKAAGSFPDNVALQMFNDARDVRYTYAQAIRYAKNVGRHLSKMGVKKGDRVALWSRLEPRWVVSCLGILYSGAIAVPLDAEYGKVEAESILRDTDCRIIFTTQEKLTIIREIAPELSQTLTIVVMDSANAVGDVVTLENLFADCLDPVTLPSISPADVGLIFFTSGTTGTPKGVVIQHRAITNSVLGLLQYLRLSSEDRVLAIIPSHHVFASLANVFVPLARGATVTYAGTVKSSDLLKTIREVGITTFPGVPQIFYVIHKKIFDEMQRKPLPIRLILRLLVRVCYWLRRGTGINAGLYVFAKVHQAFGGHLRLLISTASYFDPVVVRDFYSLGFTVQQGYGMTETFGGGTLTPFDRNVIGSVGVPIPGVKLDVIAPNEAGVGEIVISGRSLMQGYFKDQESTKKSLKDGWFHTGDLGYRDAKDNYYVTGRKKEMVVLSSGKNVYPEEVENHYLQSPYIQEMCVLGVADLSNYACSERLHAIIVPEFDHFKHARIVNSEAVIRWEIEKLSLKLPAYKRIMTYEVRAEPLPRTRTRKLRRWVIQQQYADSREQAVTPAQTKRALDADDALLMGTTRSAAVLGVICKESSVKHDLQPDMNLELDLGFDSLRRIELIANIEQLLNLRLGDDSISQLLTIRDLLSAVDQSQSGTGISTPESATDAPVTWREILFAPDSEAIDVEHLLKASTPATWFYLLLLKSFFILSKVLFRLEVRGIANIPHEKPFLICPNHQSYLDGILVSSVFPYSIIKDLFSVGYSTYFRGRLKGAIARLTRIVPIDPDTNLVRAMQASATCLRAKKVLLIFPEGDRTYDGELLTFKKGAAILAQELRVPVLPVAVDGSFDVWSKVGGIRLARIKISIGEALHFSPHDEPSQRHQEDYDYVAQRMRDEVKSLLDLSAKNGA